MRCERPEQAGHRIATAGRGRQGVAGTVAGPEGDEAEPIRSPGHEPADDQRRALRHVRLPAIGRPEMHRGRLVEEEPGRQLPVGHVLADLWGEAAGGRVPVDPPHVVARLVRPEPVHLQTDAKAQAAVVAGHAPADPARECQLEAPDEIVGDRPRAGPGGGSGAASDPGEIGHAVGSAARSSCGALTRPRMRATTESGVMPSVRAE